MIWFTDTSALVKRYVNEVGSLWLRHELPQHQVIIAQITSVEDTDKVIFLNSPFINPADVFSRTAPNSNTKSLNWMRRWSKRRCGSR